jgi:thiol-disulfide isomerase/thioredoxin
LSGRRDPSSQPEGRSSGRRGASSQPKARSAPPGAATRIAAVLLTLWGLMLGAGAAQGGELKSWTGGATPALALRDPTGKAHDLAAYRGKVVVVNFWATWCAPCREEMPSLQALREQLAGKGFEVLAVNLMESEEKIAAFRESELIDLPVLMDRDGAAAKRWKVRMLPISFVIDRQGSIRYQLVGEATWTGPKVAPLIERLIGADTKRQSASAAR